MLDAALEMTGLGHRVALFTARCEPHGTFDDARIGGLDIRVRAHRAPRDVFQRARVPCAVIRMVALAIAARRELERIDVLLCDLVPHAIPQVQRIVGAPVVFYCHFPDCLLAPAGGTSAYRYYRRGVDALASRGMNLSARIVTNSHYTLSRLREVMPDLSVSCEVICPGVDPRRFLSVPSLVDESPRESELVMLAFGRFHPDKNHELAVEAFHELRTRLPDDTFARLRLVIAGGLGRRHGEALETFESIRRLVRARGLHDQVRVVPSPTDEARMAWFKRATLVLHTARDEHFGIVPIEAMAAGRPVVAVNAGGITETVRDGETGLLCDPSATAFATATARLLMSPRLAAEMGAAGRRRAALFTRAKFGERLERAFLTERPE